jgi:hypothetical protein
VSRPAVYGCLAMCLLLVAFGFFIGGE